MTTYTRRVLAPASRVLTAIGVVVLIALLPWLSGRDPALSILRARSAEQDATEEALSAIRRDLGLDAGPLAILGRWVSGAIRGDFGRSWNTSQPVLGGALEALGVSVTLMGFAAVVAALVAAVIVAPAVRGGLRGRPRRRGAVAAAVLTSVPEFLLASVAVVVGAVWLGLPPYGWTGPGSAVLPALALGLPAGGLIGKLVADAVAASFTEPWVLTWTVAGISRRQVATAVVRRALPGLTSQIALVMVAMTGGAVAVEQVFAIPGLGRSMLGNARSQDLPALQIDVLLLLVLAGVLGVSAALARRALLGASMSRGSLRAGSLPPAAVRVRSDRRRFAIPASAAALLVAMVVAGLPRDPYATSRDRFAPPSAALPFGADASGRDMLARVAHGALHTISLSTAVVLGALVLGVLAGLAPRLMIGPIEVTNAAPPIIAGILVATAWGPSAGAAAVAVLLVSWAPLAAHTAALVEEAHAAPHVAVLPTLGAGRVRILVGSVLPSVVPTVVRHAVLRLPGIALALAALGFLGLGPQPPSADWGLLLADGVAAVERAPWVAFAPLASLILLSVVAVSLSGAVGRRRAPRPDRAPSALS